jgi:hypothetical protein
MELPISLDLVIDRLNRLLSDLIFILATALQAEDLARSLAHSETIHGKLQPCKNLQKRDISLKFKYYLSLQISRKSLVKAARRCKNV